MEEKNASAKNVDGIVGELRSLRWRRAAMIGELSITGVACAVSLAGVGVMALVESMSRNSAGSALYAPKAGAGKFVAAIGSFFNAPFVHGKKTLGKMDGLRGRRYDLVSELIPSLLEHFESGSFERVAEIVKAVSFFEIPLRDPALGSVAKALIESAARRDDPEGIAMVVQWTGKSFLPDFGNAPPVGVLTAFQKLAECGAIHCVEKLAELEVPMHEVDCGRWERGASRIARERGDRALEAVLEHYADRQPRPSKAKP